MKISTRGRYALRIMTDLAENTNGNYIPLKEISARQKISHKYLESIMLDLSKTELVEGRHGKGGGYKLNRAPQDYIVYEILQVTEGDLSPVTCLDCNADACERVQECKTLPVWAGFYKLIKEYFSGITLLDLINDCGG